MSDLLLANLRTIGTHHCDGEAGKEAADEIERLRAERAALRAERDAAEARAEAAQDECEYAQDLVIRQGNMLRAVVNALRGPPPEDMLWSVHDAQELAAAMRARAERAEAEAARLRAAIERGRTS